MVKKHVKIGDMNHLAPQKRTCCKFSLGPDSNSRNFREKGVWFGGRLF